MGFMDKAKKMAEQAQTKLDEVQKQFNEGQSGTSGTSQGPPVEYDQHGRPVRTEQPAEAAAPPPPPAAEPAPPPAEAATPPHGDPVPPQQEDPNNPSYEPPKLTGGDPLAG